MNSQYKKLAYERSVLLALVRVAKEKFLTVEGADEPALRIECEELPRNESQVPEDPIIDVVLKLMQLAKNRELEMAKFDFVSSKEKTYEQEWSEEKERTAGSGKAKPRKGSRKGKGEGSEGDSEAPAT